MALKSSRQKVLLCSQQHCRTWIAFLLVSSILSRWLLFRRWEQSSITQGGTARRQSVITFFEDSMDTTTLKKTLNSETSVVCLSPECIENVAYTVAPVYQFKADVTSWCLKNLTDSFDRGLLLVKNPKSASSTSAGAILRIAHRNNCSAVQYEHRLANEAYTDRYRPLSYLFTTVREPADRAVSRIFFQYSRAKNPAPLDDATIIHKLKTFNDKYQGAISAGQGGFQLQYLSPTEITPWSFWPRPENNKDDRHGNPVDDHVTNVFELVQQVRRTMEFYDFILVQERMDESLVAMSILMGIDIGDVVLTGSSKVAGSSYIYKSQRKTCKRLVKSYRSPAVRSYLNSSTFIGQNYGDYILHRAAQYSLDRTITETIGRERFDAALARYRKLQTLGTEICAPHAHFPCSGEGIKQLELAKESCYAEDLGCGYKCIDEFLQNISASNT